MESQTITFAILTVSDRCYEKKAVDESGPALEKLLSESVGLSNFKIEKRKCVPDEVDIIQNTLKVWVDEHDIHIILTTGGTGFAPRDVTPEATRNVIDKEASGITFAMVKESLNKTPMAMLSRAVCGIRRQTLIINLPGNKKGSTECLGFIIGCIPHAVALIRNWLNKVEHVHSTIHSDIENKSKCVQDIRFDLLESNISMPASGTHHCSKVDVSHVARRLRTSPYPMISFDESVTLLKKVVSSIAKTTQEVPVRNALGHALSKEVIAEENLPPFPASVKDGYAVIASDGKGVRTVTSDSIAGSQPQRKALECGGCVRINTGAPVPNGADAVVQVEDTKLVTEADDGLREVEIEILVTPKVGQDIRAIGSDIRKGQVISKVSGNPLTSQDLGLFAAVGVKTVHVYRQPIIAIFSTGNELQESATDNVLKPGHVWDSNRIMLTSLLKESGCHVVDLGIAADEPNEMLSMMNTAVNCSDIIVTTGSVSMGDKDLLKEILKRDINAEIHFGRVNLKPGKPTTFATCKGQDGRRKLIFCLPGNPVSAYVTCHLYVIPAVRSLSGYSQSNPTIILAAYKGQHRRDEREEFQRGVLNFVHGKNPVVEIVGGCMLSSNILSCHASNCLVRIPPRSDVNSSLKENDIVECLLTGNI